MDRGIGAGELARGLRALGVQPGMALEVHCSLGQLGHMQGGADAVIDALMEAVGAEGAIVMPSFRLSRGVALSEEDRRLGLTSKIRILAEDEGPSAMGIVADTFRKRADVRTGSGIFRVSAWGKDADKHAAGFQRIIAHGGYALLLGVDIYSLSAMHYVEDVLPQAIRDRFRPSEEALAKYPEAQWMIEAWSPPAKPWYTIQDEAYEKGLITDGLIGNAKCMFFQVQPVIELYRQALLTRPLALYGLS